MFDFRIDQHFSHFSSLNFPVSLHNHVGLFLGLLIIGSSTNPFILTGTQVSLDPQTPNSLFVVNKGTQVAGE